MEIAVPPETLNRLLRHPALRAHGPSRAPWQGLEAEHFLGRQRRLNRADAAVELVLLQGQLRAGEETRPCLRLRIDGPDGMALAASLALTLPLLPAPRDMAAEAATLLAPPPRTPALAGQTGTAGALAAALREGLGALMLHAPHCHAAAPPLGVHQSRVALRRMRSVLRLFRPAVDMLLAPGALAGFDGRLRAMAGALGPARDWDVFLAGLGARMDAALPGERRLRPILRGAARARLQAYAALPELLTGAGFRATIWQGMALAEALDAAPPRDDLLEFAALVLGRRHRRLKRAGARIETLPPAELHALRLDAKRLRYATDLLYPLWEGQAPRRYLRRLMALQEALGLANDAEVARGLVRDLGVSGWALGLAEGFALSGAAGSRDQALDAWGKWRKVKRFWKSG